LLTNKQSRLAEWSVDIEISIENERHTDDEGKKM